MDIVVLLQLVTQEGCVAVEPEVPAIKQAAAGPDDRSRDLGDREPEVVLDQAKPVEVRTTRDGQPDRQSGQGVGRQQVTKAGRGTIASRHLPRRQHLEVSGIAYEPDDLAEDMD